MGTKILCPHCKGFVSCPSCTQRGNTVSRVTPDQLDAAMEELAQDSESMKTELAEVHDANRQTAAIIELYRQFARKVYEISGFSAPEIIPDKIAALLERYEITNEGYSEAATDVLEEMNLSIIHLERCFRCGSVVRLTIDLPGSKPAERKDGSRPWCGRACCSLLKQEVGTNNDEDEDDGYDPEEMPF